MTPSELFLDFETRSRSDLRRVGAHRYAEDPSTEVTVVGYALDDGPVCKVEQGDIDATWLRYVYDPAVLIVAHNAEFERLILMHKYGLAGPDASPRRFRCTAAQAARAGLPRGLEMAAAVLGVAAWDKSRKDRVIRKLCAPRRATGGWWEREDAEDEWDELEGDCMRDVETCRQLYRMLPQLGAREQRLWELTVGMNDRGLAVDLPAVRAARALAETEQARVAAEFEALVGCAPGSPAARDLAPMCKCRAKMKAGKVVPHRSLDKTHVRRLLRDETISPMLRQALTLRKRWARSSLAKLDALVDRTSADGRLRGQLVYAGAERTARWSSRGVQWHNAPRGLGDKTELAFEALAAGALRAVYEDPLLTISDMLKGFLVGPFLCGDFKSVEARDLAWQAGQDDLVADFAAGRDAYLDMASAIYGYPVAKDDFDEAVHIPKRQLGKVAVLGCGYGLGAEGLQRNAEKDYDILLDGGMADRIVTTYRRRYRKVPRLWDTLSQGFRQAVKAGPGHRFRVGPVCIGMEERAGHHWAYIDLPSGRRMYYFDAHIEPSGDVTYYGRNRYKGGKWERVRAYGGLITENVVQATSRDFLAEALIRLDDAAFPLVLQVHDEAVAEAPAERLAEFKRLLELVPDWAPGMPLAADCFSTLRYRKG